MANESNKMEMKSTNTNTGGLDDEKKRKRLNTTATMYRALKRTEECSRERKTKNKRAKKGNMSGARDGRLEIESLGDRHMKTYMIFIWALHERCEKMFWH